MVFLFVSYLHIVGCGGWLCYCSTSILCLWHFKMCDYYSTIATFVVFYIVYLPVKEFLSSEYCENERCFLFNSVWTSEDNTITKVSSTSTLLTKLGGTGQSARLVPRMYLLIKPPIMVTDFGNRFGKKWYLNRFVIYPAIFGKLDDLLVIYEICQIFWTILMIYRRFLKNG